MSSLLVALVATQWGSSVMWEWWDEAEECAGNSQGNVMGHEWTAGGECLHSLTLRETDPLRQIAFHELNESDYDVHIECRDPEGSSSNINAKDDFVLIIFHNSTNASCRGEAIYVANLTNDDCGTNYNNSLASARFHCSSCAWVFMNESPPPYFIQAIGIFVFLIACILINFCLQDHVDRAMKVLPGKLLPCLSQEKQVLDSEQITPGVLVAINLKDQPKLFAPGFSYTYEESPAVGEGEPDIYEPRVIEKYAQEGVLGLSRSGHDNTSNAQSTPLRGTPLRGPSHRSSGASWQRDDAAEPDDIGVGTPAKSDGLGSTYPRRKVLRKGTRGSFALPRERRDTDVSVDLPPGGLAHSKRRGTARNFTDTAQLSLDIVGLLNTENSTKNAPKQTGSGGFGRGAKRHTSVYSAAPTIEEVELGMSTNVPATPLTQSEPGSTTLPYQAFGNYVVAVADSDEEMQELRTGYDEHEASTGGAPLLLGQNNAIKLCVVCGYDGRPGEVRESGYKCTDCIGKSGNSLLMEADKEPDPVLIEYALAGAFGEFADVLAIRSKSAAPMLFLSFRHCTFWMRSSVADKMSGIDSEPLTLEDTGPKVYVSEERLENKMRTLCQKCGFKVTHTNGMWKGLLLTEPVSMWVPAEACVKVVDWGGQFARVGEKGELEKLCGDKWQKWWSDFELCVGELMRIERVPDDPKKLSTTVSFKGSATIVMPMEGLSACTQEQHDSEYLITPQKVERRTMMAVFVASAPPLLAAKGLFLMTFFAFSIVTALSDGHGGRANKHSTWEAYEEVYFKLFNSGYPTLMADCGSVTLYFKYSFQPTFKQFVAGVGKPVLITLIFSMMISLPGIVTHALPMVFLYCWLWGPMIFGIKLLTQVIQKCLPPPPQVDKIYHYDMFYYMKHHKMFLFKSGFMFLTFRFLAELVAVLFVQTNFNYAIFIYEKTGYFETIVKEFNSRQIACILEMGMKLATMLW